MDLQWGNNDESEALCIKDEDCNIDSLFEQERCGICMDIVIDRGVLDCCDHWFCFACIDNWAIITNLCPICKNEFQLITCLPVYDTIRSIGLEEHPISRNEDWSFEGKNNTLSFPSYYISEDAVKCLENDGCKLQSEMLATEDDLSFDTSIACDSCDIWYHAFCVGFNPEFTSGNSWLCPRCINNEVPQKSGAVSVQSSLKYSVPQTAEIGWTVDSSLSGKVSVSVADDGETAVVISMIEGKQNSDCGTSFFDSLDSKVDMVIEKSSFYSDIENSEADLQLRDGSCIQASQNSLLLSDYKMHHTNLSDVDCSSECFFDISPEIIDFQSYGDLKEAAIPSFSDDDIVNKPRNDITESESPSTLQDEPFSLCSSEANDKEMTINAPETVTVSVDSDVYIDSSFMACGTSKAKDAPDNKCDNIIGTRSADPSTSSADNMVTSCTENMVAVILQKNREGCNLTEKPNMETCTMHMDESNDCIRKREPGTIYPVKKLKLDRSSKTLRTGNQSLLSSQVCSIKDRCTILRSAKQEEAVASDIMSIVQASDCASHDRPTEMKANNKYIRKKDSTCGLRMKKIMRRVGEKRESSIVAQELGKEIREVAQYKTLKGAGMSDFDEKLLAAFRAAIVRPQTDMTNGSKLSHIGEKRPLLGKGKKRENLTKKIYGTAGGRRRHAWARDLEIEFWKRRCRRTQPDKVETLQSVLELLKKATNPQWNSSIERDSQEESKDSILSRVYIADASVFPRKDDIKPLSELSGSYQLDCNILEKEKSSSNVAKRNLNDDKNSKKNSIQISKNSLLLKANSFKAASDSIQISGSNGSKESIESLEELSCPSDAKTDKRKWALEVLARKTSTTNANKGQEDGDLLKGKYPFLAQLPQDMRPVLASTRHNKVSASVRQAQLYRIAEHYLRRTNLSIIRRTAETELAVADAVNVEREICERSNSKLVYVNLCSQAVSQLAKKPELADRNVSSSPKTAIKIANEVAEGTKLDAETDNETEFAEMNLSSSALSASEVSIGGFGETNFEPEAGGWSSVEEALKLAGLSSDSPPSSPYSAAKDFNGDVSTQENLNEGLNYDAQDNVLHSMDTEQDASVTQNPGKAVVADKPPLDSSKSLEQQKENGPENSQADLSMENVLEGLNYDAQDNVLHSMDTEQDASVTQNPGKVVVADKPPLDSSNSLEQQKENGPENSQADLSMENVLPALSIPERGMFNEPTLEDCEENKMESSTSQINAKVVEVLNRPLVPTEDKNPISGLKENCILSDPVRVSETDAERCISDAVAGSAHLDRTSAGIEDLDAHTRENVQISPIICDNIPNEEMAKLINDKSDLSISISKKVEAYIKEHIRPLCKSGVITVEQYQWAVRKTLDKVMKFHHKAKNANFLIREGGKIKKLAEQYAEAAQQKDLR